MSPKQLSLYWREWAAARRVLEALDPGFEPDMSRHDLHRQALGRDVSSQDLTNEQFDAVLAAFRAVSQPANLAAQLRQQDQPLRRLRWKIEHLAPEAYIRSLSRDRFGTEDWRSLGESDLTMLRNTLAARAHHLRSAA